MRLALSFAILVALGSIAHAGDDVGVVVDGDNSQPQLTAQLADWLTRHGYHPVLSPLPPDAVSLFTDVMRVDDQAAGRAILEKSGATPNTVYARVNLKTKAAGARDLTVTVYWLVKGRDATSQKQDCERCTDQLLRGAIDDVMKKLLGGGALGHVKLKSSPPNARISIDGQAIGVTPLDWDLPSGKHAITMDKTGYRAASRDVVVASDKLELVVVTLDPVVSEGAADRPSLAPSIATIALGAAAIGVGAYLIAIDEDETGAKPTYKDSAAAGAAVAAGGAVVAIVGGIWLYKTRQARSAPVAAITRDAAYIGWLGHF